MRALSLWAPVFLLMAFIFYKSSQPDPGRPPAGLSDKSAHFLVYAALGGALVRALAGARSRFMTVRRVLVAAAIAIVYGISDEAHQAYVPGRTPDPADLAADAAGAVAGAAMFAYTARGIARRTG